MIEVQKVVNKSLFERSLIQHMSRKHSWISIRVDHKGYVLIPTGGFFAEFTLLVLMKAFVCNFVYFRETSIQWFSSFPIYGN